MSSSLEDGAARRSRKVTERPSGLDEPLVQMLSGIGFGWNAEPGAFRCPRRSLLPAVSPAVVSSTGDASSVAVSRHVPRRADTPTGDSGAHAILRIFRSALVGGLEAAVVLSQRESEIRG